MSTTWKTELKKMLDNAGTLQEVTKLLHSFKQMGIARVGQ